MNFVTLEFATFFLFVLVAGWLLRERDGEYRAFLLVCNLFFYALAGMAFVPLLLAVAVLNWGAVHLMSRFSGQPRKRKGVIALDVALHVALLAFFKYYEFLILAWNRWQAPPARHRHPAPCVALDGDPVPRGAVFLHVPGVVLRHRSLPLPGRAAARVSGRAAVRVLLPHDHGGADHGAPGSSCRSSGTGHGIPATCRKGSRLSSAGCSRRS